VENSLVFRSEKIWSVLRGVLHLSKLKTMDKQKFDRAAELQAAIKENSDLLNDWNNATGFSSNGVKVLLATNRGDSFWIRSVDGTFEVLKAVAIQSLTTRLKNLQTEFDNL
jgi:hypothetical protein